MRAAYRALAWRVEDDGMPSAPAIPSAKSVVVPSPTAFRRNLSLSVALPSESDAARGPRQFR